MGDGWETKRNRTPGNKDWVLLKLAKPGYIHRIIVDTNYFKGNYPDACMIEGCLSDNDDDVVEGKTAWQILLPMQKLSADTEHEYEKELTNKALYSHVRLTIFPDGGVSRLRLFGTVKN
jgi:allantoicase